MSATRESKALFLRSGGAFRRKHVVIGDESCLPKESENLLFSISFCSLLCICSFLTKVSWAGLAEDLP